MKEECGFLWCWALLGCYACSFSPFTADTRKGGVHRAPPYLIEATGEQRKHVAPQLSSRFAWRISFALSDILGFVMCQPRPVQHVFDRLAKFSTMPPPQTSAISALRLVLLFWQATSSMDRTVRFFGTAYRIDRGGGAPWKSGRGGAPWKEERAGATLLWNRSACCVARHA